MKSLIGYRKIILTAMGLGGFIGALVALALKDSASILAVGVGVNGILGSAVYGNVKEHQATAQKANSTTTTEGDAQ